MTSAEFDALKVVTNEWLSNRVLWKRADCWAEVSFRHALNRLVDRGLVERTAEPTGMGNAFRYLYRKKVSA